MEEVNRTFVVYITAAYYMSKGPDYLIDAFLWHLISLNFKLAHCFVEDMSNQSKPKLTAD